MLTSLRLYYIATPVARTSSPVLTCKTAFRLRMNAYEHQNKVILNYIHDLFQQGRSIEEIAVICNTKVWCIQNLFAQATV